MGACLSCLGLSPDDSDLNEQSSLLGSHEAYSDEYLQEDLLKQRQRQNELNAIVNTLTDDLIDVSTFLSTSRSHAENGAEPGPSSVQPTDSEASAPQSSFTCPAGSDDAEKAHPVLWAVEKKKQLLQQMATSHVQFDLAPPAEPLYVVF